MTVDAQDLKNDFLSSVNQAAMDTFVVQCQTLITPGSHAEVQKSASQAYDIASVINISGGKIVGALAIGFPEVVYKTILSAMLGEKITTLKDEDVDGAAELLNIIYGQLKTKLNDKGYSLGMAIPTIFTGKNLSIKHFSKSPVVVIPYNTPKGAFHMEFGVDFL